MPGIFRQPPFQQPGPAEAALLPSAPALLYTVATVAAGFSVSCALAASRSITFTAAPAFSAARAAIGASAAFAATPGFSAACSLHAAHSVSFSAAPAFSAPIGGSRTVSFTATPGCIITRGVTGGNTISTGATAGFSPASRYGGFTANAGCSFTAALLAWRFQYFLATSGFAISTPGAATVAFTAAPGFSVTAAKVTPESVAISAVPGFSAAAAVHLAVAFTAAPACVVAQGQGGFTGYAGCSFTCTMTAPEALTFSATPAFSLAGKASCSAAFAATPAFSAAMLLTAPEFPVFTATPGFSAYTQAGLAHINETVWSTDQLPATWIKPRRIAATIELTDLMLPMSLELETLTLDKWAPLLPEMHLVTHGHRHECEETEPSI